MGTWPATDLMAPIFGFSCATHYGLVRNLFGLSNCSCSSPSCRIMPPLLDPHLFHRLQSEMDDENEFKKVNSDVLLIIRNFGNASRMLNGLIGFG